MMTSHVVLLLLALVAMGTTNGVEGAKKKKKLPSGVSQHQYCHGCIATIKELSKKVPASLKKNREHAVIEAMEKICTNSNFVTYNYSPPKTVKACKALLEDHEEDIETALHKNTPDIEELICHKVSQACHGVDVGSKDEKFSDIDLTKDGEGDGSGGKTVKIDPTSGKVVQDAPVKNEGKTLSKKDKKKKTKKSKKGDKKEKKEEPVAAKPGVKKGAIHNLNIDINDPSSMQKVMDQINSLKNKYEDDDEKDEL